jgi:hypothetical protein
MAGLNDGRWLETCGCGRETRIKDYRLIFRGGDGSCPASHPNFASVSVNAELGWCGCGSHEDVDAWMLAYLRSRAGDEWPKPQPEGVSEDAAGLLAYMADDLGWTEHGGSIYGAWLTDEGRLVIQRMEAAHAATS